MTAAQFRQRPRWRSLVKLACLVLLGRARAHYHSWLPYLDIAGRSPDQPGQVRYRGEEPLALQRSQDLLRTGAEKLYIVGSGPSVRGQDLSVLPDHSAILLNGAISLIGGPIKTPLAVAIEDERFVYRHLAMIREHVTGDTACLLSVGAIRAFFELDPSWLEGRRVALIEDIRKPYGRPRRSVADVSALNGVVIADGGMVGFARKPDLGVFQGGSVAISALQFGLATGTRTVGLIGIDIANADGPRFYERGGAQAFSGIAGAEGRILAHIGLARDVAAQAGQEIVNHSPVSALRKIGLDYRPLPPSSS